LSLDDVRGSTIIRGTEKTEFYEPTLEHLKLLNGTREWPLVINESNIDENSQS